MRFLGVILASLILIISCSQSGKKYRIPDKELVKILADIHIADAISFSTKYRDKFRNNDSITYFDKLFAKYHVTRSQFDSTIAWYSGNPDKYELLYDKVLDRLNRMYANINDKLHSDSVLTQVGNLWNKKRDWILPEDGATENISFAIKVLKKGKYMLSARIKIAPTDQSLKPYLIAFTTRQKIMKPDIVDSTSMVKLDKSGIFRNYSVMIYLDKDTETYIKGYILGNEFKQGSWSKNAEVRDIRLFYIPPTQTEIVE
jgi:hypothetical protein